MRRCWHAFGRRLVVHQPGAPSAPVQSVTRSVYIGGMGDGPLPSEAGRALSFGPDFSPVFVQPRGMSFMGGGVHPLGIIDTAGLGMLDMGRSQGTSEEVRQMLNAPAGERDAKALLGILAGVKFGVNAFLLISKVGVAP